MSIIISSLFVLLAGSAVAMPAKQLVARDSISYNLGNYPDATNGPINDAISYLNNNQINPVSPGQQGARVSCSYGTGIFVSVDNNGPTVSGAEAALALQAAYE